jgi:glycine cleavage system aminomethyltransferase T
VSAREQHLATRRAAGLFDFSFMGLYEFEDRSALQPLQSRDLSVLQPGQIAYTLLLNPDGSVYNDATAWRLDSGRWWLFTGRRSDSERVRGVARDRSGEYAIIALQGPASAHVLARLVDPQIVRSLRYFHFVATGGWIVGRLGYSGELGYEVLVPRADSRRAWDALLAAGREHGVVECGFEAANSLRIESGYVLFDREIDGQANPSELGLDRLTGRRFPVRQKLVGLEILQRPAPAELPAARVTSECFSPMLQQVIALGFCAPQWSHPGTELRLADGRLARAARLPFYDPERRRPRAVPLATSDSR